LKEVVHIQDSSHQLELRSQIINISELLKDLSTFRTL
jgi:hypothetical protein